MRTQRRAGPTARDRFERPVGRAVDGRDQAIIALAKTDALDAQMLALSDERVRPTPSPVPDAYVLALSGLMCRRRQLVAMIASEAQGKWSLGTLALGRSWYL